MTVLKPTCLIGKLKCNPMVCCAGMPHFPWDKGEEGENDGVGMLLQAGLGLKS